MMLDYRRRKKNLVFFYIKQYGCLSTVLQTPTVPRFFIGLLSESPTLLYIPDNGRYFFYFSTK